MGDFSNSVVTTVGNALFNTAVQNSQAVTITKVSTGDGVIGATDPHTLTNLISLKQNITPASANTLVAGQATFTFTIDTFAGGFTGYVFREVGIFGKIGAGAETLLTYASTTTPDTLTVSTTKDTYTLVLKLSTAATMTCTVNMEFTLPLHAAQHLDNGLDPLPVFTSTRTGSVPIGTGNKKQYLSGASTWENTLPVITSNLSITVISSGTPDNVTTFPSIQAAHDYLLGFQFYPGITVTINVQAGTYSQSSAATISHPNASQITIVGPANATAAVNSVGTPTGSSGNWTVPVTVSSTANMSVNGYVYIQNLTFLPSNYNQALIDGLYQITGIAGSVVSINVPLTLASFPVITGITAGSITPITAILSCTNCNGFTFLKATRVSYIVTAMASATSDCHGFSGGVGSGLSTFNFCGAFGFKRAGNIQMCGFIAANGSIFSITNSGATGNENGAVCSQGGVIQFNQVTCNYNSQYGIWSDSGYGTLTNTIACGNSSHGILGTNGAIYEMPSASTLFFLRNNNYGIYLSGNCRMAALNNLYSLFNVTYDLALSSLSSFSSNSVITATNKNVTAGTLSADGCYLS
jgi:hypothetical protein